MFERIKGAAQKVAGHTQEGYGNLVGDDEAVLDGQVNQASGHARMVTDEALDHIRTIARSNPIATIAVVGGLALFFGAAMSGAFSTRRNR